MAMKLFKKCCITKELDGTKDDAILSDCDESDFSDSDICANVYDDVPMTAIDLDELFGKSHSESEFEGLFVCLLVLRPTVSLGT